jgi:hypothetical protein
MGHHRAMMQFLMTLFWREQKMIMGPPTGGRGARLDRFPEFGQFQAFSPVSSPPGETWRGLFAPPAYFSG